MSEFTLFWSEDHQEFKFGDGRFYHQGPTDTEPTHDLAHLIVAANGGLHWLPDENDANVRICEYNAVFVEVLLGNIFNHLKYKLDRGLILNNTIKHMRWFVEHHYAPFPVVPEEAYRAMCLRLQPEIIGFVAPLFFDLRSVETGQEDYRKLEHVIGFSRQKDYRKTPGQHIFAGMAYHILAGLAPAK